MKKFLKWFFSFFRRKKKIDSTNTAITEKLITKKSTVVFPKVTRDDGPNRKFKKPLPKKKFRSIFAKNFLK